MPFARRRSTMRSRTRSEVSASAPFKATLGAPTLRSKGRSATGFGGAARLASVEAASTAPDLLPADGAALATGLATTGLGVAGAALTAGFAMGLATTCLATIGLATAGAALATGFTTGLTTTAAAALAG